MTPVAYDGETMTTPDGETAYVLLAGGGKTIYDPYGLTTEACLALLSEPLPTNSTRVWYGLHFDAQWLFRDLPHEQVLSLMRGQPVVWHGYDIEYRPGRQLILKRTGEKRTATHYDVTGWWRCPLLEALARYGLPIPEILRDGKAARGLWDGWTPERVTEYNAAELVALETLVTRLHGDLQLIDAQTDDLVDMSTIRSWNGPGVLARRILGDTTARKALWPEESYSEAMRDRIMRAYVGGRVECYRCGAIGEAHRYDLVSAYAAAAADLPGLRAEEDWEHVEEMCPPAAVGVYRVAWNIADLDAHWPGPLPYRDTEDTIVYPSIGTGWYHASEVQAAMDAYPGRVHVIEGWIQIRSYGRPLHDELNRWYDVRAGLAKHATAAKVVKLALASIYGKLAQATRDDGRPRYQCYTWAGMVCAQVRAWMLRAMMQDPDALVCAQTDAIMTTQPIRVSCGARMGQWQHEGWTSLRVLQSGIYDGVRRGQADGRHQGITPEGWDMDAALAEEARTGRATVQTHRLVTWLAAERSPELAPSIGHIVRAERIVDPWRLRSRWYPAAAGIPHGIIPDLRTETHRSMRYDMRSEGMSEAYEPAAGSEPDDEGLSLGEED